MRGLILDLRFNPGGLLDSSIDVADLFVSEGRIVSTSGRNHQDQTWDATKEGTFSGFPIAVLVNRYSASGSEIVAACLQDHDRAVVIGERTWGKGSVQNVIELEEGNSVLKLTTASYCRPSGKNIHRFPDSTEDDDWGVMPDEGYAIEHDDADVARLYVQQRRRDIIPQKNDSRDDSGRTCPCSGMTRHSKWPSSISENELTRTEPGRWVTRPEAQGGEERVLRPTSHAHRRSPATFRRERLPVSTQSKEELLLQEPVHPIIFRNLLTLQVMARPRRPGRHLGERVAPARVRSARFSQKSDQLLRAFQDYTSFGPGLHELLKTAKEFARVDRLEQIAAVVSNRLRRKREGRAGLNVSPGADVKSKPQRCRAHRLAGRIPIRVDQYDRMLAPQPKKPPPNIEHLLAANA